ncbi:hypothetical protein FSARC_10939 [Fusarium sarcochroum]|uniref:Heterokaryon incompatibility domain-containing protein n=1 Tax=Fusarium sarcochroum TaxID=1208366 RepID=A0A8H4TJ00_9HYPO|nr:hypothetical protein FSARC_10939 [Fusarium sarcochroum]
MEPHNLVCGRCWRDFFDTEPFEKCCTASDPDSDVIAEATSTVDDIKDSASSGCTWCSYINEFINDSQHGETRVMVSLSPSSIKACTPKGRNVFSLSISCHSPTTGDWKAGWSLYLHAFTTLDDRASEYVTARPLRTDVGSEVATRQIQTWLKECEGHGCCSRSYTESKLPTRVIEINPVGQQEPRIIESSGRRGAYATLSYCWGTVPFQALKRSNYAQFTKSLNMKTLPLTIRDAITTAGKLSIPYIWIDALCIIQDSEDDKIRDIATMKDIYASSALTMVAASSKEVSEGLLHDRHHSEDVIEIPFRGRLGLFGTMFVNELNAVTYDERSEPLAKRAWTMQEQILAHRTLTFSTHTMIWSCKAGTKNFGDSLHFPYDLDMGYNDEDEKYGLNLNSLLTTESEARSNKDMTLSCWLRLVTAYSLRKASFENDKLNAVAGIASHPSFVSGLGPRYFAGIWEYKLARQLTWYTSDWHRTLPEGERFTFHRPTTYRAPSWSWASLEGGIIHFDFDFNDEDEPEPEVICEVTDCSTETRFPDRNPFGEVISAYLRLRGFVRNAWFNPQTSNVILLPIFKGDSLDDVMSYDEAWKEHVEDFKAQHPDVDLEDDPEAVYGTDYNNTTGIHDESRATEPIVVSCFPVTLDGDSPDGVVGLLLAEGDGGSHRRIRLFKRGKNEDFENLVKREIMLL